MTKTLYFKAIQVPHTSPMDSNRSPVGRLVSHLAPIISVADTGIGIAVDQQARVFERFYRVDKARSRDMGGTGLSLAIGKHLGQVHGGSIRLESQLGTGIKFQIRLPLK